MSCKSSSIWAEFYFTVWQNAKRFRFSIHLHSLTTYIPVVVAGAKAAADATRDARMTDFTMVVMCCCTSRRTQICPLLDHFAVRVVSAVEGKDRELTRD